MQAAPKQSLAPHPEVAFLDTSAAVCTVGPPALGLGGLAVWAGLAGWPGLLGWLTEPAAWPGWAGQPVGWMAGLPGLAGSLAWLAGWASWQAHYQNYIVNS